MMKIAHFGQKIIFSQNYGGGVILTYGVDFGIKSLVSASVTLHRVVAIKFQNFPFSANYHPPLPMQLTVNYDDLILIGLM